MFFLFSNVTIRRAKHFRAEANMPALGLPGNVGPLPHRALPHAQGMQARVLARRPRTPSPTHPHRANAAYPIPHRREWHSSHTQQSILTLHLSFRTSSRINCMKFATPTKSFSKCHDCSFFRYTLKPTARTKTAWPMDMWLWKNISYFFNHSLCTFQNNCYFCI